MHRSYLGAFLSLAIITVTVSYAISRFTILRNYSDTVFQKTSSETGYSKENPLSHEDSQFDFAFSLGIAGIFDPVFIETEGYVEFSVIIREFQILGETFKREDN